MHVAARLTCVCIKQGIEEKSKATTATMSDLQLHIELRTTDVHRRNGPTALFFIEVLLLVDLSPARNHGIAGEALGC